MYKSKAPERSRRRGYSSHATTPPSDDSSTRTGGSGGSFLDDADSFAGSDTAGGGGSPRLSRSPSPLSQMSASSISQASRQFERRRMPTASAAGSGLQLSLDPGDDGDDRANGGAPPQHLDFPPTTPQSRSRSRASQNRVRLSRRVTPSSSPRAMATSSPRAMAASAAPAPLSHTSRASQPSPSPRASKNLSLSLHAATHRDTSRESVSQLGPLSYDNSHTRVAPLASRSSASYHSASRNPKIRHPSAASSLPSMSAVYSRTSSALPSRGGGGGHPSNVATPRIEEEHGGIGSGRSSGSGSLSPGAVDLEMSENVSSSSSGAAAAAARRKPRRHPHDAGRFVEVHHQESVASSAGTGASPSVQTRASESRADSSVQRHAMATSDDDADMDIDVKEDRLQQHRRSDAGMWPPNDGLEDGEDGLRHQRNVSYVIDDIIDQIDHLERPSITELESFANRLTREKSRVRRGKIAELKWRRWAVCSFVTFVLLMGALFGVVIAGVQFTKDTRVNQRGVLTDTSGQTISTAEATTGVPRVSMLPFVNEDTLAQSRTVMLPTANTLEIFHVDHYSLQSDRRILHSRIPGNYLALPDGERAYFYFNNTHMPVTNDNLNKALVYKGENAHVMTNRFQRGTVRGFTRQSGVGIRGHNDILSRRGSCTWLPLDQCAKKCCSNTNCRSFDFRSFGIFGIPPKCCLSSQERSTVGRDFIRAPFWTYYEKRDRGFCDPPDPDVPDVVIPPTPAPTAEPTAAPSPVPTDVPTSTPTGLPTPSPTTVPTSSPTGVPTSPPTPSPTGVPTPSPTQTPTTSPTGMPTLDPSEVTNAPTPVVTNVPTPMPTDTPTSMPTNAPSPIQTNVPSAPPTWEPSALPSDAPSPSPTDAPTLTPTDAPTAVDVPTPAPTEVLTPAPTLQPTEEPDEFEDAPSPVVGPFTDCSVFEDDALETECEQLKFIQICSVVRVYGDLSEFNQLATCS